MESSEKTHFELLAGLAEELPALVGERSFDLLSSGKKLEVEGLMTVSPTFHGHTADMIARRIRGIAKSPRQLPVRLPAQADGRAPPPQKGWGAAPSRGRA